MDAPSPNTAIDAEILSLQRDREDAFSQFADAEQRLAQAGERLRLIDAQIAILRKVRPADTAPAPPNGNGQISMIFSRLNTIQLRPTEAILELLKDNPSGLTEREVVDELEDKVVSESKNKRRLIAAMLYQQRQKGRVIKVGRRHCLAPEGGGKH